MIKILICCASGSGTSQLMAITAQKACKKRRGGSERQASSDCGRKVSARNYDLVLTSQPLSKCLILAKAAGVNVYPLKIHFRRMKLSRL
ncbi:MAG: hypothetical protein ACLSA6_02495 [Holdemania massiliensis]